MTYLPDHAHSSGFGYSPLGTDWDWFCLCSEQRGLYGPLHPGSLNLTCT